MITGSAANPQNPTHVWTGLCESGKCAMTLRSKTNFLDLSGQAKIRWVSKVSGFQKIHPIVKLADGTFLAGDWADGSTGDWRESEAYFAEMRWVKMDPARVATTGAFLDKVDLSKVDEIGWSVTSWSPAATARAAGPTSARLKSTARRPADDPQSIDTRDRPLRAAGLAAFFISLVTFFTYACVCGNGGTRPKRATAVAPAL